MLIKLYNNVTTRSNTFAVYCTIGYFEVTNYGPFSATNRPILGKEIGSDDGTNIRHKFFAVVDRTKLTTNPTTRTLQGGAPVFLSYEPQPVGTTGNVVTSFNQQDPPTNLGTNQTAVTCYVPAVSGSTSSISGIYDGASWTLQPNRRRVH